MTVAFRENSNGSVTVTEHKIPITISRGIVDLGRIFSDTKTFTPKPSKCWSCGAEAMYHTRDRRGGPELTWITYQCGECGMREEEPFD